MEMTVELDRIHQLRIAALDMAIRFMPSYYTKRNQAEEAAQPAGDWQQLIRAARDMAAFLENG